MPRRPYLRPTLLNSVSASTGIIHGQLRKGVVLRPLPRLTAMVLRHPPQAPGVTSLIPSMWSFERELELLGGFQVTGGHLWNGIVGPYSTYPKPDVSPNVQSSRANWSWAKLPNCNRIESLLLLNRSPQAFAAAGSRLTHSWCLRNRYRLLLVT